MIARLGSEDRPSERQRQEARLASAVLGRKIDGDQADAGRGNHAPSSCSSVVRVGLGEVRGTHRDDHPGYRRGLWSDTLAIRFVFVTAPFDIPFGRFESEPAAVDTWLRHVTKDIVPAVAAPGMPVFLGAYSGGAALALTEIPHELDGCIGGAVLRPTSSQGWLGRPAPASTPCSPSPTMRTLFPAGSGVA